MINSFTHSKAMYLVIRYSLRITTLENHVLGSQSNLFELSDRTHYTKQRVVSLAADRVMTTHLRNKVLSRRFSIFPLPSTDMSTLVQGTQAQSGGERQLVRCFMVKPIRQQIQWVELFPPLSNSSFPRHI